MPKPGRNDPCPCGSGRKTKRCCREQRGSSEDDLTRAHLAQLARQTAPDLAGLSDRALDHPWDGLMDLPAADSSLLVALPKLIGPDLQRLREAIEHDDPDWGWDVLTTVHQQIDTPQQRARLADAIVRLRDQRRINHRQAAYALLDLSTRSTRSSPPACSKPSPSPSASAARPAASISPPNLLAEEKPIHLRNGRARPGAAVSLSMVFLASN
jgi:SEC-C motif